jgi:ABC-2 type transport system permease protein
VSGAHRDPFPFSGPIAALTVRQLLARRRGLLILLLVAVPVALAAVYRGQQADRPSLQLATRADSVLADSIARDSVRLDSIHTVLARTDTTIARRERERATSRRAIRRRAAEPPPTAAEFAAEMETNLVIMVVLPLVALVFGSAVFGAEIDDGTAIYIFAKPIPRWHLVLTKWIVASVATALVVSVAALASGLVIFGGLDPGGLVLGFTAASVVGAVVYCALFVALSLATRRALIAGLVYVVVWEGLLAQFFAGTRVLSVREYALAVVDRVARVDAEVFQAQLTMRTAGSMSVAVTLLALAAAVVKLRAFEVGKEV